MLITDGLIYILDVSFTLICMHEIPTGVPCLPWAEFLQSCAVYLFYGWLNISPGLSSHNTPTSTTHQHDQRDHINTECGVCLFKKQNKTGPLQPVSADVMGKNNEYDYHEERRQAHDSAFKNRANNSRLQMPSWKEETFSTLWIKLPIIIMKW